jgi:calcineurin-like phosphoesterase family protein
MPNIWLASDHHFGHEKTCTAFKKADGTPLRPFSNAEEMDEELVRRHNEVVKPNDKCYFLGDVVIRRQNLQILNRLNGKKVLIRGNHDIFKLNDYAPYFKDIRGYHVLNGLILSHVPVHTESLARFGCNIHGHLHANRVRKPVGINPQTHEIEYGPEIDPRYFNVSVEQINFTPISFENLLTKITKQGGHVGFRDSSEPIM